MDLQLIAYLLRRGLMMMLRYKKFNQQFEFCNDYHGVPADQWQVARLNHFTAWFNDYVGVKPGFGLAQHLGYANNIDNQEAVAWWLDLRMKYTKCPVYSLLELKNLIKNNAPEHFFFN
jgi:hypothetical protein